MTPFHLFIIAIVSFALIIALILACRNSEWEAGHSETGKQLAIDELNRDMNKAASEFEAYQERERQRKELDKANIERYLDEQRELELERLRDRQDRERQEITQKLDTDALEASLQGEIKPLPFSEYLQVAAEDESDTRPPSPPLSNAELSAMAYLEDLEG